MSTLVAVVTLLGALTALNMFLLLGVVRRLREMSMSTVGTAIEPGLPSPGDRVGEFSEKTVSGEAVTADLLRDGRTLAVFLSPSCQPCQLAATLLTDQPHGSLPTTLVFVHTEPDDPQFDEMRDKLNGLEAIVTISGHSAAARAFGGIAGYPTSILVEDGVVVAASMDLSEVLAATRGELLPR